MRVLVLTSSYPAPGSVAGVFVREHARAVAPYADVRVVHLDRGGRGRIRRLTDEDPPAWRSPFPAAKSLFAPGVLLAAGSGLRAACADGWRPDLLHAHFFVAGFPAVVLGKLRGLPTVVTEHWTVFLPEDPASLSRPLAALADFTFARADLVLPVSEPLEGALRARGVRTPMRVVPNAVDVDLYHPPAADTALTGPARLLLVGTLTEQKGIDLLLRALPLVESDVRLDVVGEGERRTDYERLAQELGVAERVVFHGLLPKPEVAELMRTADLYVSASRFENNPVAVIEALASGLPVVGTDVGAVARMVGEDGIVVPAGDPHAIAAGIEGALAASYDRQTIASRAAARYCASAVGRALAEAYSETLRARQ